MELHKYVCWWTNGPGSTRAGGIFLVKMLSKVSWRFDGLTYRATNAQVPVRICRDGINASHPSCGEEFVARGRDLVAVQHGEGHH